MNETVFIKHPTMPDSAPVEVRRISLPHYLRAGWAVVETETETAPAPVTKRRASEGKK